MKKVIICFLLWTPFAASCASSSPCDQWPGLLKPLCVRLHNIWANGNTDLYISGYAWHNRYTYRPEKIKQFNEAAWGGGLGRGIFDEVKKNWQGIYAIAFEDSHRHLEPAVGYAYLKIASLSNNLKAGLGYSILVTARTDINGGIPFPGILPWASVFYKQTTLAVTYIPGAAGAGNVLYVIGKYAF